jgi:hypothetical protein
MSLAGHNESTARDAWRKLGVGSRPCRVGRGQGRGSWRLRRSRRRGAGAARMPARDRPGPAATDLGLARASWPAGLRWGAAAATLVSAAYVLVYLTEPVREALPDGGGGLGRVALWRVLVVIPLGPALPEELASVACCWRCWAAAMACSPGSCCPRGCSACGMLCRRWAAGRPTPRSPPWWALTPLGWWHGSSLPWASRRWPAPCSVGRGCAVAASSLPYTRPKKSSMNVALWSSVVVIGRFTTASSPPTPRDALASFSGSLSEPAAETCHGPPPTRRYPPLTQSTTRRPYSSAACSHAK